MAEVEPTLGDTENVERQPFLRALRRLNLLRPDGTPRTWWIVAIAWGPLLVFGLVRVAAGLPPPSVLYDLSVHVRMVVVIPLVLTAGRMFSHRYLSAMEHLYGGKYADDATLERIVGRAQRIRDSRAAELTILIVAVLAGQASLWGLSGPTGLFAGVTDVEGFSYARAWYVAVGLPIVQFLYFRWAWRWLMWTYVLARLSRERLATNAAHPDHASGLGFLNAPITAYAMFILAFAAMLSSVWATRILEEHASLSSFAPIFIGFVLLAAALGLGPLLLFTGILYRERYRELHRYNQLALDYVHQFERKWVEGRAGRELLGTPDIQSFNDLNGTFETVDTARIMVFGTRELVQIWAAAVLPMLPLVATTMPFGELVRKVGRGLLDGLPV